MIEYRCPHNKMNKLENYKRADATGLQQKQTFQMYIELSELKVSRIS